MVNTTDERLRRLEERFEKLERRLYLCENKDKSVVFEFPDEESVEQAIRLFRTAEGKGIKYGITKGSCLKIRIPSVDDCKEFLCRHGISFEIKEDE